MHASVIEPKSKQEEADEETRKQRERRRSIELEYAAHVRRESESRLSVDQSGMTDVLDKTNSTLLGKPPRSAAGTSAVNSKSKKRESRDEEKDEKEERAHSKRGSSKSKAKSSSKRKTRENSRHKSQKDSGRVGRSDKDKSV